MSGVTAEQVPTAFQLSADLPFNAVGIRQIHSLVKGRPCAPSVSPLPEVDMKADAQRRSISCIRCRRRRGRPAHHETRARDNAVLVVRWPASAAAAAYARERPALSIGL